MFFENWLSDANKLLDVVPDTHPAYDRGIYLAHAVANKAVEGTSPDLFSFEYNVEIARVMNQDFFVAVETPPVDDVDPTSPLACIAQGKSIEGVITMPHLQAMVLPNYSGHTKYGNGMIILHALQHITERTELPDLGKEHEELHATGMYEDRAYGLNLDIFRAIDGDRFDEHLERTSMDFKVKLNDDGTHKFSYSNWEHDPDKKPPIGTLMRELLEEGGISSNILLASLAIAKYRSCRELIPPEKYYKVLGMIFNRGV